MKVKVHMQEGSKKCNWESSMHFSKKLLWSWEKSEKESATGCKAI